MESVIIRFPQTTGITPKTQAFLKQLFGEKIGPVAPEILCSLTLELPAITHADALAQTLREAHRVTDPTVASAGPGRWKVTASYAALHGRATELQTEGLSHHGTGVANALVREFFHHRSGTDVPHVLLKPSPKLGKQALKNRAEMLTGDFKFLPPGVGVEGDCLSVTLPQFQSLRSAWQSKAESSRGDRAIARILDDSRIPEAFGTRKEDGERDGFPKALERILEEKLGLGTPERPPAAHRVKPAETAPADGDAGTNAGGKRWATEPGSNVIRPTFGRPSGR